MSEYLNRLKEYQDLSPQDTVDLCKQLVPQEWQNYPSRHPEINHGINRLQTPEALNCYTAAYGNMHLYKCRIALQNFPFKRIEKQVIEIVDWGCGQGLGTLCVLDALRQREMLTKQRLKNITLVEPSEIALKRACDNITKATNGEVKLNPIQCYLPSNNEKIENEISGIEYYCQNIIHIFSNILDIPTIHLEKLANLMTDNDSTALANNRTHYILCIGPMNKTHYRIDRFCELFRVQDFFSNVEECKGERQFTCKTKCFLYDKGTLNLNYSSEVQEFDKYEQEENFDESDDKFTPNWHSYKDGKHTNLTTIQKSLAESIVNKEQKISGVAGSGKTQVLATRAVNAQKRTGGDILILTYNITLSNYLRFRINEVRADFDWDKIHIRNYHKFYKDQAEHCLSKQELESKNWNDWETYDIDIFTEKEISKYQAIFIDEVQDFKNEWLQIIHQHFLASKGEFVVFGDPKQKIYDNQTLDKEGNINLGIIKGVWNKQLTKGHRFQSNGQLAKLASDFQRKYFQNMPIESLENESLIQDSLFTYTTPTMQYANIDPNINAITDMIIQIIQDNEFNTKETAIISCQKDILKDIDYQYRQITNQETMTTFFPKEPNKNNTSYKSNFTMFGDKLKFSTIHSFKGWEAENIIFILTPNCKAELVYTAITRAKESLIILNCGNLEYSSFFNETIKYSLS
ncbi:UvrD-helicase domain-containing protein [Helicobacter sp.]|uniref:UvrD-helicase domain-containing protein n=1 Tax=Helicobacter sp. TaxID=218 RepID=UPI0019ABD866|nr:UvrD-helicase domain-containing protein [Helicobacter sp.]MBD5165977.1 AAA family ATPase [Helicobacter sp.]